VRFQKIKDIYKGLPIYVRWVVFIRWMIFDFESLLQYIPSSVKRIQEIGCGYGLASFMLASQYPDCHIEAFDLDSRRINCLKSVNPFAHLEFFSKNALEMKQFDTDVILMVDVLHHLTYSQQRQLLNCIKEQANEDVIVIIKDMEKGRNLFKHLLNYLIDVFHMRELVFYYHEQESFIKLFQSCGFQIKKQEYLCKSKIPLNHIVFVLGVN